MNVNESSLDISRKLTPEERAGLVFVLRAQIYGDVKPDAAYFSVYRSIKQFLVTEMAGNGERALGGLKTEVCQSNADDLELLDLHALHQAQALKRTNERAQARQKKEESVLVVVDESMRILLEKESAAPVEERRSLNVGLDF